MTCFKFCIVIVACWSREGPARNKSSAGAPRGQRFLDTLLKGGAWVGITFGTRGEMDVVFGGSNITYDLSRGPTASLGPYSAGLCDLGVSDSFCLRTLARSKRLEPVPSSTSSSSAVRNSTVNAEGKGVVHQKSNSFRQPRSTIYYGRKISLSRAY